MMKYFRRPQLVGNNLPRVTYGKVRGSIRRSDADGTSALPYFPGVSIGETIILEVDGTPYTVTLTGVDLQTILDDLNDVATGVGLVAQAIDDGGAIGIYTLLAGSTGSVEITGGSASAALGFNVNSATLKGLGGDISSSPEGRVGNHFGTALLGRSENLSPESVQRGMGRISANCDVLFADVSRTDGLLKRIDSWTISGDRTYITPAAATRVFTGGPTDVALHSLTRLSTKEDLAPYFFLKDNVTGQPAASRVVAVVRGAPVGEPPYADATAWSGGGSIGNVLGIDLVKQSGVTIDSISEGRIVTLSVALGADVSEGDLLEVIGATNTSPWSNNGLRWVLERKIDSTHIVVRPMSASELATMGASFGEMQPFVELNGTKTALEAFGTISVHAGYSTDNVNLTVRPPIPENADYELWVCTPTSIRDARPWNNTNQATPASLAPHNDLDTSENVLLSAPTITGIGTDDLSVGGYYVRWHGRPCYVPPIDIEIPDVSSGYAYWDARTCATAIVPAVTAFNKDQYPDPSLSAAGAVGDRGIPLAHYENTGTTVDSITNFVKVEGSGAVSTVGWNGDFPTLEQAINHLNRMAAINSETAATIYSPGSYPHYKLVLLNDQSMGALSVSAPSLTLEGAHRGIRLSVTAATAFTSSGLNRRLFINNLTIKNTVLSTLATNFLEVHLNGIEQDISGALPLKWVAVLPSAGKLVMNNCRMNSAGGLASGLVKEVYLYNTHLTYLAEGTIPAPQIVSSSSTAPTAVQITSITDFVATNCSFTGWTTNSNTIPLFITDNGTGRFNFVECVFGASGTPAVGSTWHKIDQASATFQNCIFSTSSGAVNQAIIGGTSDNITVQSCRITAKPQSSGYGVKAGQVSNCIIDCPIQDGGQENNTALYVTKSAIGNHIKGIFITGAEGGSAAVSTISSNYVYRNSTASATNPAGIKVGFANSIVSGNYVDMDDASANGILASAIGRGTITGNSVRIGATGGAGISLSSCANFAITGNSVQVSTGTSHCIELIDNAEVVVSGNSLYTGSVLNNRAVSISNTVVASAILVIGNLVEAQIGVVYNATVASSFLDVTGNTFVGAGAVDKLQITANAASCRTVISDNLVNGSSTFTITSCAAQINSNVFNGAVVSANSGSDVIFTGNYFHSTATISSDRRTSISGSTFNDTASLDDCVITGCVFKSAAADHDLNDCSVSASNFLGDVDLTDADVSACFFDNITVSIDNVRVVGCYVDTCTFSNLIGTTTDKIEGCSFVDTTSLYGTVQFVNNSFSGSSGTLTFDGAAIITNNDFSRPITISTAGAVVFTSNKTTSTVIFDSSCIDTVIESNSFLAGTTFSYTAGTTSKVRVIGNRFDVDVTIDVNDLLFSDNYCALETTLGKQTSGVSGTPPTSTLVVSNNRCMGALVVLGKVTISNTIGESSFTTASIGAGDLGHNLYMSNCVFTSLTLNECREVILSSCTASSGSLITGEGTAPSLRMTGCNLTTFTTSNIDIIAVSDTTLTDLTIGTLISGSTTVVINNCGLGVVSVSGSSGRAGDIKISNTSMTSFSSPVEFYLSNCSITGTIDSKVISTNSADPLNGLCRVVDTSFSDFETSHTSGSLANIRFENCSFTGVLHTDIQDLNIYMSGCRGGRVKLESDLRHSHILGNQLIAQWDSDHTNAALYILSSGHVTDANGVTLSNLVISNNTIVSDNSGAGTGVSDVLLPAIVFGQSNTDFVKRLTLSGNHIVLTDHPSTVDSADGYKRGTAISGLASMIFVNLTGNTFFVPQRRGSIILNNYFFKFPDASVIGWTGNRGYLTVRNTGEKYRQTDVGFGYGEFGGSFTDGSTGNAEIAASEP